jgi:exodeoxyribonuclease VII large subunit
MSDLQLALSGFESRVARYAAAVDHDERLLRSLDPQAVLKRGYGIVRDAAGRLIRDAAAVDKGAGISVQLHRGGLEATVTEKHLTSDH